MVLRLWLLNNDFLLIERDSCKTTEEDWKEELRCCGWNVKRRVQSKKKKLTETGCEAVWVYAAATWRVKTSIDIATLQTFLKRQTVIAGLPGLFVLIHKWHSIVLTKASVPHWIWHKGWQSKTEAQYPTDAVLSPILISLHVTNVLVDIRHAVDYIIPRGLPPTLTELLKEGSEFTVIHWQLFQGVDAFQRRETWLPCIMTTEHTHWPLN